MYALVGHENEADLPTIYVGQGDPVRYRLTVAPVNDPDAMEYAEPHELYKDPINGIWPAKLAD